MRVLVVMHLKGQADFAECVKQYDCVLSGLPKEDCAVDSYLYTKNQIDISHLEKNFTHTVYYQKAPFLEVHSVVDRLEELVAANHYEGVFCLEDGLSCEIAVMLANKLKWQCMTNVKDIQLKNDIIYGSKLVYNNNFRANVKISARRFVVSLMNGVCKNTDKVMKKPIKEVIERTARVVQEEPVTISPHILSYNLIEEKDIRNKSDILIAVGRGIKTKDAVERIRIEAQKRGYMFGVTRPLAMNAWAKIGDIIGVSGGIFAPKICVTIGVSGSAAFYTGIENSDYIISINRDKKAPIISMSDVSMILDYEQIMERLWEYI